jgi:hypothetical protein
MALFSNRGEGVLINVDFRNGFRTRLERWLYEDRPDLYWGIEYHERGVLTISVEDIPTIIFHGDNGILELEMVEANEV